MDTPIEPWVAEAVQDYRALMARAETAPPAEAAEIRAWLDDHYAQVHQLAADLTHMQEEFRVDIVVPWRARLCTWLAEAEQELAGAKQEMARAKARAHRAFRTDEVKAASEHCHEAEDRLDEALEKVRTLTECVETWTPDGRLSAAYAATLLAAPNERS